MDNKISLRAARIDRNMGQEAVAKEIGVSTRTIGKWEKGETYPNGFQLMRLCELYGRSLNDIRLP